MAEIQVTGYDVEGLADLAREAGVSPDVGDVWSRQEPIRGGGHGRPRHG